MSVYFWDTGKRTPPSWSFVFKGPKGPCTQTVYTLAPEYLYRDYFKAKVYTI